MPPWLRFRPLLKEKVWGGDKLVNRLGKNGDPARPYGESWEISEFPGSLTVVDSGPLAAMTLGDLRRKRPEIFGSDGAPDPVFPLLIKFIHAREVLSVQVHPSEELEPGQGKTEAWVIVGVEPGSRMIKGFCRGLTREEFSERLESGALDQCLKRVPVQPLDVMFMPGRMIHAIGAGIVLMEIQQTSDMTYRIYDWGRTGMDGKPRPLHIQEALRVMDLSPSGEDLAEGVRFRIPNAELRLALACRFFAIEVGHGRGEIIMRRDPYKFHILSLIQGSGAICSGSVEEPFRMGETLFLTSGPGEILLKLPDGGAWVDTYAPRFERDIEARLRSLGIPDADIKRVWREVG